MKKKYIAPVITILPMDCEPCQLLAASGTHDEGMDIPKDPTPGVSGDAKEDPFRFEGSFLEDEENQ